MIDNNYYFSHTSFGYLDEQGNKIKSTLHVSPVVNYQYLLKCTEIGCLTVIYDAEKIGKFYMSEHAQKQDYALWLSILKNGINSYGIDIELAYYRLVKNSVTSKKYKLILKHVSFLKETQNFNTIQAIYYTMYWMVNGFIRYFVK
jgi:teichuronic acid biosynthesis glycosyltransferase TuaG